MWHWLFTSDSKGNFPGNGVVSVLPIIWMFHFRSLNTCPAYYMLPWIAYVRISQSASHQVYLILTLATLQSNNFQITHPIKLPTQDVLFKLGLHMDYAEHVLWVRSLNMHSLLKWWPHLPLVSSTDCGTKIRTSCEVTCSRKCTINVPTNWHNKYALRTSFQNSLAPLLSSQRFCSYFAYKFKWQMSFFFFSATLFLLCWQQNVKRILYFDKTNKNNK